jgi:hypothetical protein
VQFFDVLGNLFFHHEWKRLGKMLALLWTYAEQRRSNVATGQTYNHTFGKNRVSCD